MTTAFNRFFADSTVFQWQKQTLRGDLLLTLPVAICMGIGVSIGHPAAGMIATGGAMNTGFGQKYLVDDSSLSPMSIVTFGMAFSGFLGVLLQRTSLADIAPHLDVCDIGWGIFRNLEIPGRYLETFLVNSWAEHLRQHERVTVADRKLEERVHSLVRGTPTVQHLVNADPRS